MTTENIFTNLLYTTVEEMFAEKLCGSSGSLYVSSGRALEDLSEAELFLSHYTPELKPRQDIWSCWNYLKAVFLLYLEIPLCCTYSHYSKYSFPKAVHYQQPFPLQNQTRLPSINASFQPKTFRLFPVQTNDKYTWLKVFNNTHELSLPWWKSDSFIHFHQTVLALLLRQQVTGKSPGEPAAERTRDKPEKVSEPALCFFLLPLRRAAATCKAIINRINYLPEDESVVYHM